MVDSKKIKLLRDKTGVSVMVCKKALEESNGDESKALDWLKKHCLEFAEKKSVRSTKTGLIESYIHNNGRIGALVELRSETDFVSRNPLFKELAHNIAMHIAASNPPDLKTLLDQNYIKDPNLSVADYLNEFIQKFGENIEIARFKRFEI